VSVLAIDTSSRRRGLCTVAAPDGTLLDHRALTGRHLDRELPPVLAALLRDDLAAVACVIGPGSYTGLRVGIAAALGLAHARDLPLHGIAALDVVAQAAPPDALAVAAVADAGRGALYVARYRRDGETLTAEAPPRRVAAGDLTVAPGEVAVTFDGIQGLVDVAAEAPVALARAAAVALRRAPLPRAGLEPVYLAGDASQLREPRV